MLKSLHIRGFKAFEDATFPRLSRLNLFVGTNNAGKTCLLEAVRLLNSNASASTIREISRIGEEFRRRIRTEAYALDEIEDPLRFLFYDFQSSSGTIEIGPLGSKPLQISLGRYVRVVTEEGTTKRIPLEALSDGEQVEAPQLYIKVEVADSRRFLVPVSSLWDRPIRSTPLDELAQVSTTVVGTSGLTSKVVAGLWEAVALTPSERLVVESLRLVEPRINGLSVISSPRSYSDERFPIVSFEGKPGRYPLQTMGDGLSRILHIALAMVSAQNGAVLIDEFENGLHWKVQASLWRTVFLMARELNVQVFATTHSRDCIEAFASVACDFGDDAAAYRLELKNGERYASYLPLTNLRDALEADVEVR